MLFTDFKYKFITFHSEQWVLQCVIEKVTTESLFWTQSWKPIIAQSDVQPRHIKRLLVPLLLKAPWIALMKCFHQPSKLLGFIQNVLSKILLPRFRMYQWNTNFSANLLEVTVLYQAKSRYYMKLSTQEWNKYNLWNIIFKILKWHGLLKQTKSLQIF